MAYSLGSNKVIMQKIRDFVKQASPELSIFILPIMRIM